MHGSETSKSLEASINIHTRIPAWMKVRKAEAGEHEAAYRLRESVLHAALRAYGSPARDKAGPPVQLVLLQKTVDMPRVPRLPMRIVLVWMYVLSASFRIKYARAGIDFVLNKIYRSLSTCLNNFANFFTRGFKILTTVTSHFVLTKKVSCDYAQLRCYNS